MCGANLHQPHFHLLAPFFLKYISNFPLRIVDRILVGQFSFAEYEKHYVGSHKTTRVVSHNILL
jgi:hypothetical protein